MEASDGDLPLTPAARVREEASARGGEVGRAVEREKAATAVEVADGDLVSPASHARGASTGEASA